MNCSCVECKQEMRCVKNGVWIQEGDENGFIYNCDMYECSECGSKIYAGFGDPVWPESELGQKIRESIPDLVIIKH